jgi:mono/diheme cytochrome c family protein
MYSLASRVLSKKGKGQMRCRLLFLTALIAYPVSSTLAQQTGDPDAGAAYAEQVCAKCHAIDLTSPSPEPTAPPFRDIAKTPGRSEMALLVWLTTSHPTMPNIVLEKQDLDNVVAFILTFKK